MAGDGRWADRINPMPKWVASTTLSGPLEWNATLIEGDVADGVRRLKSEVEGELHSHGAGAFATFLVEQGLADELDLWVNPTIQGVGDRPFFGRTVDLGSSGPNFDSCRHPAPLTPARHRTRS